MSSFSSVGKQQDKDITYICKYRNISDNWRSMLTDPWCVHNAFLFFFSATSVSISTSEQTRVERLKLTRKQLADLARYTKHKTSAPSTCTSFLDILLPSSFSFAKPIFQNLYHPYILSNIHTFSESQLVKQLVIAWLGYSLFNSAAIARAHCVHVWTRLCELETAKAYTSIPNLGTGVFFLFIL